MESSKSNVINPRDSNNISPWQFNLEKLPAYKVLFDEQSVYDTLIVGAGITGLTTALLLQSSGKKCIIAEAHSIGFGTTGGTTAHLNTFFDATYPEIENDFGKDAAKLVAESGKEALQLIADLVQKYHINCDFEYKDAYLFSEEEKESNQLTEILEASRRAGINVVEGRENDVPIPFQLSVLFKDQGQFHPIKYLHALAVAFIDAGGIILENTFIRKTSFDNNVHFATADQRTIKAYNLVYATHIPPGINILNFRCAPYRSYVLGIKLSNGNYPEKLVYDMKDPYHYFRTHVLDGEKFLILGGEDHKTGHEDPELAYKNLEEYASKYYNIVSVDFKWSSQYYIPVDGLPYIGLLPAADDNIYVASGFNGNGMMFGTLSGKLISDLILGKENKYSELFKPSRLKPLAGFTEFIKENTDVAFHFVKDRLSVDDIDSLKELSANTGRIVNYQNQKLGIYKDKNGELKALNPVCTHAGCIVNFNQAENSWDCPCHGGRFDIDGKVLTGPPRDNLKQVHLDD